jgi:hypothetical protein
MAVTPHRIKVEIVHTEDKVKKVFDLNTKNMHCTIRRLRDVMWRGGHLLCTELISYNFILSYL